MNKQQLLSSAKELQQVNHNTAKEYLEKSEILIGKINTKMLNREDIKNLIGENNLDMMKDNHANHARFIHSILTHYDAETLVDTILWVFRAYRSHGFSMNYWAAQLNAWIEILKEVLSEESYAEIHPYYNWMLIHIPAFVSLSDEKLGSINPVH
ncbi:hypothetical protein DF185_12500 [Marinifilum breve]|uniref:Uncharacterized protein n=1 Tax=Marinifilum breve TaxID=2184082 RepID=A0A2V3ZWT3_9BACT|nr:hypothetical protein [Marinifilum breve]PXY00723.1 hypothetical protein DF185_12500 [Marinifilum breve]